MNEADDVAHISRIIMDDEDAIHADQINVVRETAKRAIDEIRKILMFIDESEHPRLAVRAIAYAFGLDSIAGGKSQTDIANGLIVERATVSKCVKQVQARFGKSVIGIAPMPGQKSSDACKTYSQQRKKKLK